ncbi:unnamed protein product [Nesidiocoris tenuis]|uniref:Uncharacterized protein n=1 Tax=Nesidiocoris tenuis TaxID=355587 RepID=A0A6H5HNY3_9HEMI|nr:unnamed protein product [Nesidiocoris tenuis]
MRSEWVNEDFSEFEQSELEEFSDEIHEEQIASDVSGLPADNLLKVESSKAQRYNTSLRGTTVMIRTSPILKYMLPSKGKTSQVHFLHFEKNQWCVD